MVAPKLNGISAVTEGSRNIIPDRVVNNALNKLSIVSNKLIRPVLKQDEDFATAETIKDLIPDRVPDGVTEIPIKKHTTVSAEIYTPTLKLSETFETNDLSKIKSTPLVEVNPADQGLIHKIIIDRVVDGNNLTLIDSPTFPILFKNSTFTNVNQSVYSVLQFKYEFTDKENNSKSAPTKLCGFLGFCHESANEVCADTPVTSCEECSLVGAGIFMFLIICLGLAILIGNSLIIRVGCIRRKKGKMGKNDICKISLAIADMLTGILLLIVTTYNFSWSIYLTANQLDQRQLELRGSAQAFAGGISYMFVYTSSIYHLLYMGLLRLYAITKPLKYKFQSNKSIYTGLTVVWMLSAISATVPAWFPHHITCSYLVPALLFLPTLQNVYTNNWLPIILMHSLFWILPYILMTLCTISTGIIIHRDFIKSSKNLQKNTSNKKQKSIKSNQDRKLFVTVAIMQTGFTITLLPIVTIVLLFYADVFNCSNISIFYLVGIYVGLANSLVNVLVYSVREKEFRATVKEIFCSSDAPTKAILSPKTTEDLAQSLSKQQIKSKFTFSKKTNFVQYNNR